jgi:hypothetical protein
MNHIPYTIVWGGAPIFIGVTTLRFVLDDNSSSFCHSERSDESHSRTNLMGMRSLVAAKAALSG